MNPLRPSPGVSENAQLSTNAAQATPYAIQPALAGHPQQMLFQLDIRRALQMHRRLAAGIFGFVLLLTAAYAFKRWNNYVAESIVSVQMGARRVMETGPSDRWLSDSSSYEAYIQQQIHNVTRPDVLADAVRELQNWKVSDETDQAAAVRLARKLEVTRVGGGYQISIKARARSADLAAQMANAVAGSYIESAKREMRAGDRERLDLLREERDRILNELATDRAEQEDLNKKLGIAAVSGAIPDPVDEQISALRSELVKARAESDQAAARLMAGGVSNSAALDSAAEEIAMTDAGIVSMKTALNARRSALITQMANLTPNHPQYKQDAEELTQINSSIENMSKEVRARAAARIQQRLKADLERTSQVEARLNAQLAGMINVAGTTAPRMQRFHDLTTDIQRLQTRFAAVDEQYRNLTMENNAPGAAYLAQPAAPPLNAEHLKVLRNILILLVVGLALALAGALVAHNLDQRVFTAEDVQRTLGFPPMAQLPDFSEVGSGVGDEYMLRLTAAVEHAYQQRALTNCIFTGVTSGAGATTVCTRVTSMLQAIGRQTVQVDASGSASTQAALRPPSGPASELVPARTSRSSALLQQILSEESQHSIVLTDAAPLLVSGETEYLARFGDSTIVVIASGETTRQQLSEVAKTLQRLEVRAAGFVLNRISLRTASTAFQESVRAVERHLESHSRSHGREFSNRANRGTEPDRRDEWLHPRENERLAEQDSAEAESKERVEPPPGLFAKSPADATGVGADHVTPAGSETASVANPESAGHSALSGADAVSSEAPSRGKMSGKQLPRGRSASAEEVRPGPTQSPARDWSAGTGASSANPLEPNSGTRSTSPERPGTYSESLPIGATSPVWPAGQANEPWAPPSHMSPGPPGSAPTKPSFPSAAPPVSATVPKISPPPSASLKDSPGAAAGANPLPHQRPFGAAAASPTANSSPQDPEDLPYSAASRLGGLRNLLVTLELNSLQKGSSGTEPPPQPGERPVYAEPYVPLSARAGHPPPQSVTAPPELIPPRGAAQQTEGEKEPRPPSAPPAEAGPARAGEEKRDPEEIDTLPSWRGQYRKKPGGAA